MCTKGLTRKIATQFMNKRANKFTNNLQFLLNYSINLYTVVMERLLGFHGIRGNQALLISL